MYKTVYFIRHGESLANAGGLTIAHDLIPLSEKGRQQAQLVAEVLTVSPSQIQVSELIRTQQTAQPFCAKHQLGYQVNPLLNEIHALSHELIEGMTGEQRRPLAQAYWSAGDVHRRSGIHANTFTEFRQRVDGFIEEMPALTDRTVIFGHGIWFGLLMWRLLGFAAHDRAGMTAFRRFQSGLPLRNAGAYSLQSVDGKYWNIQIHAALWQRLQELDS